MAAKPSFVPRRSLMVRLCLVQDAKAGKSRQGGDQRRTGENQSRSEERSLVHQDQVLLQRWVSSRSPEGPESSKNSLIAFAPPV